MKSILLTAAFAALLVCLMSAPARADYQFSFGNPTFINGDPFKGAYFLDKAGKTNEYAEDPRRLVKEMMKDLTKRLDEIMKQISDKIDTLNVEVTFNNLFQVGNGNIATLYVGGSPLGIGTQGANGQGRLSQFDPTWGME